MSEVVRTKAISSEQRESLILEHVPLLRHIVGRLFYEAPGAFDRDDLFGFGMLGLIAAADGWDESRGLAFSTFAYPKIRGAILDELRKLDFLPRGRREKLREVEAAVERLSHEHGKRPDPETIAHEIGISSAEVDEVFVSAATAVRVSLESDSDADVNASLRSMLADPTSSDPIGSAEFEEQKERLVDAIAALPEQEKTVITLYYAEDLYLREIAEMLGVTESRVSQIHSRAVYRLNQMLQAEEE